MKFDGGVAEVAKSVAQGSDSECRRAAFAILSAFHCWRSSQQPLRNTSTAGLAHDFVASDHFAPCSSRGLAVRELHLNPEAMASEPPSADNT